MKYEIKREIRSESGAWLDSETVYECEAATSKEAMIEWAEINGFSRWENDMDLEVMHDPKNDRAAMHIPDDRSETMIYHARRPDDPTGSEDPPTAEEMKAIEDLASQVAEEMKHGGKREGSGQKPKYGVAKITTSVAITPLVKEYFDASEASQSELVEVAIRRSKAFREWLRTRSG